jgi:hypothetical protein
MRSGLTESGLEGADEFAEHRPTARRSRRIRRSKSLVEECAVRCHSRRADLSVGFPDAFEPIVQGPQLSTEFVVRARSGGAAYSAEHPRHREIGSQRFRQVAPQRLPRSKRLERTGRMTFEALVREFDDRAGNAPVTPPKLAD